MVYTRALELEVDRCREIRSYSLTRQSDGKVWSEYDARRTLSDSRLKCGGSSDLNSGASVDPGESTQVTERGSANGANFYTKLTGSDYRLAYDGTKYTMTRLSDNAQWSDADRDVLSDTIKGSEGFSISTSAGTFAAGDSFIIKPVADAARNIAVNTTVAADVRLVAAAMPFRTKADSGNTGNGTITAGNDGVGLWDAGLAVRRV
jgi:hypothetical protein